MSKKIIICTTFREFNSNANDSIQRIFLESLKKQTYTDFELAVTIFKEKNVETTLKEYGLPFKIFQGNAGDYRYSLTQVISNGTKMAKECGRDILVWTNSDVVLDDNFTKVLSDKAGAGIFGTSHPHPIYYGIGAYLSKDKDSADIFNSGIDVIFFGKDIFNNQKFEESIQRYPNYDHGWYEHFLTVLGKICSGKAINIVPYTIVCKIDNDRKASNETCNFFTQSDNKNLVEYDKFLADNSMRRRADNYTSYYEAFNPLVMMSKLAIYARYQLRYKRTKRVILNKNPRLLYLLKWSKKRLQSILEAIYDSR